MPAKPQKDMGPPQPTKIGGKTAYISEPKNKKPFKISDIKVKIDTTGAAKAGAELRQIFDRLRERVMQMFLEWLESEEGQKAIKEAIKKELKR